MARGPVTVLFVLLALVGAPAAFAQTPSLQGELLTALGSEAVSLDCDPDGISTGSYTVFGTAIGPFPGTFEETGSFTIEDGQVTAFEATFTIQSGLTNVQGTKTLRTSTRAVCLVDPTESLADFADFAVIASYEATITTPFGTFIDHGRASGGAQLQINRTGQGSGSAQESFISEAVAPAPTAGHTTGGGYVGDVVNQWVSFGFTARSDGATVKGQCSVSDHVSDVHVKCLDVTLLARTATHAAFEGHAVVNGVSTTYRIDVDDLGEPGAGSDRFEIETASGFSAAGVLAGGNIQIRD